MSDVTHPRRGGRLIRALAVVVAVMVLLGAGWGLARQFESPAQRDARAKPPPLGNVFEKVNRGPLEDVASGSGKIEFTKTASLTIATVPANAVVTAAPARRLQAVGSGSVITEINGRPLYLLAGEFDFYRDLKVGDKGPDVRQLQQGLQTAGYFASADGEFGKSTLSALKRMFADDGYTVLQDSLPLSEVVVNASLPGRLVAVPRVGSHPVAGEAFAKLSAGVLRVIVQVDGPVAARLESGMEATVTAGAGSRPVRGSVESVRDGADGLSSVIVSTKRPLSDRLAGEIAVAQFTLSRVAGDALLVPSRAVATDSTGSASVMVRDGADLRRTQVTVLGEQTGVTALSLDNTDLKAGDDVLIK